MFRFSPEPLSVFLDYYITKGDISLLPINTLALARYARLTDGQDTEHLGERRPGSLQNCVFVQAADGVPHLGVGIVRYASHAGDGPGGNLELLGDYYCGRDAVHLQFYTVVQTALAAGASVPDGEDCCVALLGDLFNQVRGGGPGGVGLGEPDDTGGTGLRFQE